MLSVPYCGSAPLPGALLTRFNLDPILIAALMLCCALQIWSIRKVAGSRKARFTMWGWGIAAAALISPLCALSVALFSARIAQHMVLVLAAAPLIALGLPRAAPARYAPRLWIATALFFCALWFWHMPIPYEATFTSTPIYWTMHVTLFGSGILLWRELLDHPGWQTTQAFAAGALSFVHMGLLGAVLTLADHPLFWPHLATTQVWGLTPLEDQQLGGALMWVPGLGLFLWTSMRSLSRLWGSLDRTRAA